MRNVRTIFYYLGVILIAFSVLQAAPLVMSAIYNETVEFPVRIYAIPALLSLGLGLVFVLLLKPHAMTTRLSMAVGTLGWLALSLLGAVPYWLALDVPYLDAVYEAASGLTTTGATVFTGLQWLPKSILFWRALTQWIGGLGIFTLLLFAVRESGARHGLMVAEAHKAATARFSPGVFGSLRILWTIYIGLTVLCGVALWVEGLSLFEASTHALTTLSTGGFSIYDASIGHFAQAGYPHAVAIEYTILGFMFLGGTSFLVFWNLMRRRWRAVAGHTETLIWIGLLVVFTGLVALADRARVTDVGWHTHIRHSLFHVVSVATTSGFTLHDFSASWISAGTQQALFLLMLVGGCVGSTAGGLKVYRVSVLGKLLRHRLRTLRASQREILPLRMGGRRLEPVEIERAVAVSVAWGAFLGIGWMATTLIGNLEGWGSLSAMASALGNVGPHYLQPDVTESLSHWLKLIYALAMIAGRLEILPLLLLFTRKTWR